MEEGVGKADKCEARGFDMGCTGRDRVELQVAWETGLMTQEEVAGMWWTVEGERVEAGVCVGANDEVS